MCFDLPTHLAHAIAAQIHRDTKAIARAKSPSHPSELIKDEIVTLIYTICAGIEVIIIKDSNYSLCLEVE